MPCTQWQVLCGPSPDRVHDGRRCQEGCKKDRGVMAACRHGPATQACGEPSAERRVLDEQDPAGEPHSATCGLGEGPQRPPERPVHLPEDSPLLWAGMERQWHPAVPVQAWKQTISRCGSPHVLPFSSHRCGSLMKPCSRLNERQVLQLSNSLKLCVYFLGTPQDLCSRKFFEVLMRWGWQGRQQCRRLAPMVHQGEVRRPHRLPCPPGAPVAS